MNGISSKPWLRTLSDAKAEAAVRLIRCALRVIPTQMKHVDFTKPGTFSIIVDEHDYKHDVFRISWDRGSLGLLKPEWCMVAGCTNSPSSHYTTIEIEDTPSIARHATPINSVRAVVERMGYWLDGLNSPFFDAYPSHYSAETASFLDKLTIAVSWSEPAWCTLLVEPCRENLRDVICLSFYSSLKDIGIDTGYPGSELHPSLANDLRAIMCQYTEVRENDFHRETDLRVCIGDTAMMSLEAPCPVEALRLFGRYSDGVPLYAGQPLIK